MSGEKSKLNLEDEHELVLETSLEDRFVDERHAQEKAASDTDAVMAKHRSELRKSILEMTNPA